MRGVFLILIIFTILSAVSNSSPIDSIREYSNTPGTQIELFYDPSNQAFAYISIDDTQLSTLTATLYYYTSIAQGDIQGLGGGIYAAIGFGTTVMINADILVCGIQSNGNQWCADYTGGDHFITKQSPQLTQLSDHSISTLTSDYAPFVTLLTFTLTRKTKNLTGIINGSYPCIASYGQSDVNSIPQEHINHYNVSVREDSNLNAVSSSTAGTTTTSGTTTTTTSSTGTTTTTTSSTGTTTSFNLFKLNYISLCLFIIMIFLA